MVPWPPAVQASSGRYSPKVTQRRNPGAGSASVCGPGYVTKGFSCDNQQVIPLPVAGSRSMGRLCFLAVNLSPVIPREKLTALQCNSTPDANRKAMRPRFPQPLEWRRFSWSSSSFVRDQLNLWSGIRAIPFPSPGAGFSIIH